MPLTDELPPLALEILRTLKQTYDHHGPNAFDEDAAKVFHVIGSIIAQVCGRERLTEAVQTLEADLEGIGETRDTALRTIHGSNPRAKRAPLVGARDHRSFVKQRSQIAPTAVTKLSFPMVTEEHGNAFWPLWGKTPGIGTALPFDGNGHRPRSVRGD